MTATPDAVPATRQVRGTLTMPSAPCRDSHNSAKYEESATGVAWRQRPPLACGQPGGVFSQVAGPTGNLRRRVSEARGNATCVSFATTDFVNDGRTCRGWAAPALFGAFLRGSG